jgi:hypothetical protein
MHVVIRHYISDAAKWEQSVKNIMTLIEQNRIPAGIKPVQYLPSVDGRAADCVWEANSLSELQKFVDRETGGARNEYFQVKTDAAINLPKAEEMARAA